MSEHEYWARVRDMVRAGHDDDRPKADIRAEIVHMVESAEAVGEHWACETLARWTEAGADADYTRTFKDMNTVTYIRRDGRRIKKTVGYSRPQRSEADGQIVGRQMQAYWDMTIDEIMLLRQEFIEQRGRLSDVVNGLNRLIAAMERHPGLTAREAWTADGHSLDEIDLGSVA